MRWTLARTFTSIHNGKNTKKKNTYYCYVSAKKAARGATRREASTTIICSSCRVPLCVFPCFGKYHIEKNLP